MLLRCAVLRNVLLSHDTILLSGVLPCYVTIHGLALEFRVPVRLAAWIRSCCPPAPSVVAAGAPTVAQEKDRVCSRFPSSVDRCDGSQVIGRT